MFVHVKVVPIASLDMVLNPVSETVASEVLETYQVTFTGVLTFPARSIAFTPKLFEPYGSAE